MPPVHMAHVTAGARVSEEVPQGRAGDACVPRTTPVRLQRAVGRIEAGFQFDGTTTRVHRGFQSGCGRLRFPRQHDGLTPTGVMLNTAGGLTSGDRFDVSADVGAGAAAAMTTQAAERVYRCNGPAAKVANTLNIEGGGRLDWLPQETILFDGCNLERTTAATMAGDATLTATELVVYGRTAMGERVTDGRFADRWRVVRDGRLVFADTTRLAGPIADTLALPGVAGGGIAVALILHVSPRASALLPDVRQALSHAEGPAGASAFDGILVARAVAATAARLRATVLEVMAVVRDGLPPPRSWMV